MNSLEIDLNRPVHAQAWFQKYTALATDPEMNYNAVSKRFPELTFEWRLCQKKKNAIEIKQKCLRKRASTIHTDALAHVHVLHTTRTSKINRFPDDEDDECDIRRFEITAKHAIARQYYEYISDVFSYVCENSDAIEPF